MNRNLLIFGLFLIIAGIFAGFYLLSVFGFLMVIPALLASSRPSPRPPPEPAREASRRIMQSAQPQPALSREPTAVQASTAAALTPPPPSQSQQLSYSPPLFPTVLLPSLSISIGVPQTPSEQAPKTQTREDDVLEMGAVLALARLLLG
ncbi:MAG: hypothetical protein JRM91_04315 [Nitrososphaerota archaeon]|jgi:hypothetical protein|nr:hypothetical protein [Nitrososphaerota archaeon]MDG6945867.1 hypothetical protein [Nitrososphaerota archaeon]MDG6949382.1 hypothetical protein [Nitrososphaerota archaeon]